MTAFELEPENPSVVFELANFYQVMNDYKTAAGYYEKAFELDKNSMDISIFRALNYLKMNEIYKSLELFLEAMKKFPSQYLILFNIGLIYYQKGNYDAAKEFLSDAYSLYQDPEIMNVLALTFFELKEYDNARNLALKLADKYPDNINILLLLAKIYIETADAKNSVEYLEKILKIFPEQPEAKELYEKIKGVSK